jgi:hypothetical protein
MLIFFYGFTLFCLFVYSFTQIDLNLTLSSVPVYQLIQKQLIQIGYFNRPLSTCIYIIILLLLFLFFYVFIYLAKHNKLNEKKIKILFSISILFLFLSYSAFSHDLFNYMFDARIVTKYHLNPYYFKALDFPDDLWTRFMNWTHRTYPYGPAWLFITIPFSFFGLGKFVLTLFLFKLLFILTYISNGWLIYKILKHTSPKNAYLGLIFFCLNPLILIESIVSSHLDSVMLLFLLLGIYLLLVKKKKVLSIFALIISGLVKFVTFPLIIIFILFGSKRLKLNKNITLFNVLNFIVLFLSTLIPILQREPYPWYFIPLIGMGSLLVEYFSMRVFITGLSFGLLLRYAPYLYLGDYPKYIGQIQMILLSIPIGFSFLIIVARKLILSKTHFHSNKK